MFSISSNDDEMLIKQSGSFMSSKQSLSDIYERSDEGDLDKKLGPNNFSASNSLNTTDSNNR